MAEIFNSVPLARSNTGAAFVYDQNIATQPLNILRQQQQIARAQQAAQAKAQAAQEADALAAQKDLVLNPVKTSAIYQGDISNKTQAYLKKYADKSKEYGGKAFPAAVANELRADKVRLEEMANFGEKVVPFVDGIRNDAMKDGELNPDYIAQYTGAAFYNPDKTLKYGNDLDFQRITEGIRSDSRSYNPAKIVENFQKNWLGETRQKFSSNGVFDYETVIKNNLPIKTVNGQIDYDPKTGQPQLDVQPALMVAVEQSPNFSGYLNARQREDEAKGITNKSRAEYVQELIQPNVRVETDINRSRVPVRSESEKEQPYSQTILDADGASPITTRNASGTRTISSNTYSPVARVAVKKNQQPYSGTLTPSTFLEVNGENGESVLRTKNKTPLKLSYGATQLHLTSPTGNILPTPSNIKTRQEFVTWAKEQVQRPGYDKFRVEPFVSGVVQDKANVAMDYAEIAKKATESVDVTDPNLSEEDRKAAIVAKAAELTAEESEVRSTNRSVLVPLRGLTREYVGSQSKGGLLPDKQMNDIQAEINRQLQPQKATVTKKRSLYERTPTQTTTKPIGKINSGGKKAY